MIYLMATVDVLSGKREEFVNILRDEFIPLTEKHGQKLVASWRSVSGTVDQIIDMWSYESFEHFEKVSRSQMRDPEWRATSTKLRPLVLCENLQLLTAFPFSPIK